MSSGFSRRLSKQFRLDRIRFLTESGRTCELDGCDRAHLLALTSPYGEELWECSEAPFRLEPEWMTVAGARLVTRGGAPEGAVDEAERRGWSLQRQIIK
jgi:hypothetical protein